MYSILLCKYVKKVNNRNSFLSVNIEAEIIISFFCKFKQSAINKTLKGVQVLCHFLITKKGLCAQGPRTKHFERS